MAVDYDPKKAHEYYERTKRLKGRRSTKGFSNTQKEQLSYAKSQLREQQKQRNARSKENIYGRKSASLEAIKEAKAKQREMLTNSANAKIDQLKASLKAMTPEQRKLKKEQISGVIAGIRDVLREDKKEITEQSQEKSKAVREKASAEYKSARDQSKATYEKEVDKAYSDIKSKGKRRSKR